MARNSRVIINRKTADRIPLAVADGLFEVARTVIETADPPDAPPYGEGLVQGGGALAYVNGKKVADSLIRGRAISKPRSVRAPKDGVLVIGGWGFPARFVEFGTIDTRPQPFLTPALGRVQGQAGAIAADIIRERMEAR